MHTPNNKKVTVPFKKGTVTFSAALPARRARLPVLSLVGCVGAALFVGGCVSVDPQKDFPAVQADLADRTSARVHWSDGGVADKQTAAEVTKLLAAPLTPDAAVQIALLNNRRLQATYESLGIAQADLVGAGLLRNPVFDGALRFPSGGGKPNVDLGVAFDFIDVFFIPLRKRIAEARLAGAKASVSVAVLDLAGQTKLAFFAVQAAEQTVEMQRQIEKATGASAELASRLREAGNNRALDLANEEALHEEARVALTAAELAVTERREALNRLMGAWGPQTAWTLQDRMPDPDGDEAPAEGLEARAVERSLELDIARQEIANSLAALGIAKPMGYLSDLEVGAAAEREDGQWSVGPSVGLPIPLFSQGQAAVARAEAEIRRGRQTLYAVGVEVRSTVRAGRARVVALRAQVERYRTVVLPLRRKITEETQLQYNAMQVGAFQLLQAKRDEIAAGRRYVELLRDYWSAKAGLELALNGRITALAGESGTRATADTDNTSSTLSGGH